MSQPGAYARRVLIVTQYFWPEPGAPSVRYAAIVRTLRALGVGVDVITGVPNYPTGRVAPGYRGIGFQVEEYEGARIHRLPVLPYGGVNKWLRVANHGSFAAITLLASLRGWAADLVIAESPPLPVAAAGVLIARRLRVPLVSYVADLWPDVAIAMGALREGALADRLRDLETFVYRHSWRITVTSERVKARLDAHPAAGERKTVLLPNGVDPAIFHAHDPSTLRRERDDLGALDGRALFMYAGTIGHAQALDTVLDAAVLLKDEPRVGFVFIGDGPARDHLVERARAAGIENVRFLPAVPPERVARYLSLARATLAPLRDVALFETTRPAKVLPSLACGRPVIFCGRGEMAALIERVGCGLVVPPEDPRALAAAVERLASAEEEARSLGSRGLSFALREYDFRRLVTRWWDAIERDLPASVER